LNKIFISPKEVKDAYGIPYQTLLRLVRQKKIPCIHMGRCLKFPISFFENLEKTSFEVLNKEFINEIDR